MVQWRLPSRRRATGGFRKRNSKKKRFQRGSDFLPPHVGARRAATVRRRGGATTRSVLADHVANVSTGSTAQRAKITSVVENKANGQFVRRNIITKGAVIQTELGKARVTSRMRHGVVNAILVEAKK